MQSGLVEVAEWAPFPKIARLNRDCIVTEKVDGTNAAIRILPDGSVEAYSKSARLTVEADNHGFCAWVEANRDAIVSALGPGLHRGEFLGLGVNKNRHGLPNKRFVLFNASRFGSVDLPPCLGVVPVLYEGPFDTGVINRAVQRLRLNGSLFAPGTKAEGVVVFHLAGSVGFKVTCEKDDEWKGKPEAS